MLHYYNERKQLTEQSCRFTFELDKLVALWDEVHYQMYILEDPSRHLTPLQKFRLRKRYPPPTSICPSGERTSNSLPKAAKAILRQWLCDHTHNPYPTIRQKEDLAKLTQLEIHQIRTWFANTRRRLRAKLKKELGSLNVGKGSKLKILTGKVDDDEDDDEEADPGGADVFQMDANQIKSLVESILKVDSPQSSQEDVNASSSTGYGDPPQRNQQMRQIPTDSFNPIHHTIPRAQTMQNLQYAPPVSMMPCRNDAPTMTIPYRSFQNQTIRPSSSLGAPASGKSMSSSSVSCPMTIPNLNRFELPQTKRQAQIPSCSSSCLCQPKAPPRHFYHQEDLVQISSDEDDREYSKIRHSITSILTQQQQQQQQHEQHQQQQYQQYQQYQRVFGVPAPMSGFVQPSDPQQIAVNKRRFFPSPPAPQRVVSGVQQAHPSSFMSCNRGIECHPGTQNCSYQQNQGTIFMQPSQTCIPNQHPAFASPRQPCWTQTSGSLYTPLQMSRTMYTSPVAVYHNFNTPSPILSANTLYSEPQYGYNQVMTPPWTPPDISPNGSNTVQISRAQQATMTKPAVMNSDPVIRLEKPPTARNLFCTPREASPCKGLTILANLVKKELDPVSVTPRIQADASILDLSHPQDEPEAGTPESSQLVIDEKRETQSTEPQIKDYDVSEANPGNEAEMSCHGDDEREAQSTEPVLAPLKPLNLGDTFDHNDHAVENSPDDQTTFAHTCGAGSFLEKRASYFHQSTDGAQGFAENATSTQQGVVGHFQSKSANLQLAHNADDFLDEPPGFPPQREVHDEPVGFYGQGREETKYESIQPLANVKTSVYEEGGTASTGLTVSPMLLTQLWQTLRNNSNSTS